MPKRARNTERGSVVELNKRRKEENYSSFFQYKEEHSELSLKVVAEQFNIAYRTAQRKWSLYTQTKQTQSTSTAIQQCSKNHSGGHNRTFTDEQESILSQFILSSIPPMTHPQMKETILQFDYSIHTLQHQTHLTRSTPPLTKASDHLVQNIKKRKRLSSHRTKLDVHKKRKVDEEERDIEKENFEFCCLVRGSIDEYGPDLVMNMDETPVQLCEQATTGIVQTASKQPAKVPTTQGLKNYLTTCPTITASGHALPLAAVIKGKTNVSLNKINQHASTTVQQVKLYTSTRGKTNEITMLYWLAEVVMSYTKCRPAALILDSYPPHFTQNVLELCEWMNLELIKVPKGQTALVQPLDVVVNGVLSKVRHKIWTTMKSINPWKEDSHQFAIETQQLAQNQLTPHCIKQAFIKSFCMD